MLHDMLATRDPEWRMSEPEARVISERFCAYASHFAVFKDTDPKSRDFRLLVSAIALMEGPRAYRVYSRRAAAKRAQREVAAHAANATGGTVIDLNGVMRPS